MLGWIAGKIYEALFTDVESDAKKTHILAKIFFTAMVLVCVGLGFHQSLLALALMIALMVFSRLTSTIIPSLIVSSIPALWLSASNAILLYYNGGVDPYVVLGVFVRTLTASMAILLFIAMLNPYELSRIVYKLGARKSSLIPVMVWRLMPLALRDVVEAYGIQKLKKQSLWKSIAISTASMLEKSDFILESNGLKLEAGLVEPLPYRYSWKHTIIYIIAALILVVFSLFY